MQKKYVMLSFFFYHITMPLTLHRAIVSTDSHENYIQFWPFVAKAWQQLIGIRPTLALIGDTSVRVDESYGDVIRFKPIPGIPNYFFAQVVRLLLPCLFADEGCILSDMDMLPISKEFFVDIVQLIPEHNFVVYTDKSYGRKYFQYPICYNAARGSTFRELFGIQSVNQIPAKIKELYKLALGWMTDELVLYSALANWSAKKERLSLLGFIIGKQRIDRSDWNYDKQLLNSGYYIDSHMLRPYHRFACQLNELFSALKLN